jgi:hypothetical protein
MIICPDCGNENIPGIDVCEQCGQSLSALSKPTVSTGLELHLTKDRIEALDPKTPLTVTHEFDGAQSLQQAECKVAAHEQKQRHDESFDPPKYTVNNRTGPSIMGRPDQSRHLLWNIRVGRMQHHNQHRSSSPQRVKTVKSRCRPHWHANGCL